jgi:hypothetical protein
MYFLEIALISTVVYVATLWAVSRSARSPLTTATGSPRAAAATAAAMIIGALIGLVVGGVLGAALWSITIEADWLGSRPNDGPVEIILTFSWPIVVCLGCTVISSRETARLAQRLVARISRPLP